MASHSKKETALLLAINKGLSEEVLDRLLAVQAKQKAGTLTEAEQMELHQLIDKIEVQEGERLEHMIALASLWGITLDQLRERLAIQTPEPHVW